MKINEHMMGIENNNIPVVFRALICLRTCCHATEGLLAFANGLLIATETIREASENIGEAAS